MIVIYVSINILFIYSVNTTTSLPTYKSELFVNVLLICCNLSERNSKQAEYLLRSHRLCTVCKTGEHTQFVIFLILCQLYITACSKLSL